MAFSNNTDQQKSDLLRVGGLWRNETKDGKVYLAGSFGNLRLMVFENGFKESENDPDYILNVAQAKPKENGKKQQRRSTPSL